jgi:nitronate monooxygenase
VLCDVVDEHFAKKVEDLGADALIAVNKEAGGHCGPYPAKELIPRLLANSKLPVISAGGVGTGAQMFHRMHDDGACGISIGSPFIASLEAPVSQEYKQACVDYGAKDIVLTTKISGSPCTVINTPYVQKIGTKQNALEAFLSKNKTLKKYVKMLTFFKGMKSIENAAFSATYKTVWCAGPSIEYVHAIRPVHDIIDELVKGYYEELGKEFHTAR